MKKFIAMLTLLVGFNANAGLLTIDLSTDEVSVGESVLVTINASDFEESANFYLDFNFDNSLMSFNESSLSSGLTLANDNPDFNGLGVTAESFGLNLNFITDDDSLMAAGDFVLASFNLVADAAGSVDLSVSNLFDDWSFVDHTVAFSGAESVTVNSSVAVSEPSAAFMMMLAGFALVSSRRKAK